MSDRFFVGKTIELAIIGEQKPAWLRALTNVPNTTALLGYKGKMTDLGQNSNLRFVVKDSYFLAVSYWVYSEKGAKNLRIAIGKYQNALGEFRARGTLDKRLIGVELSGFQEEEHDKWTAVVAHRGKTLEFVVKRSTGIIPLSWEVSEQDYSPEEAKDLQRALGKYQTALEELRSTGEVRGWL